jgi:hypothetical protein
LLNGRIVCRIRQELPELQPDADAM